MTMDRKQVRSSKRSERGNAVLEFALSWFILWMVFAGVYQFGYSFYVYNSLLTAVSDAAQLGSRMSYDVDHTDRFTNALTNMVVYGDTQAGANPIVANLTRGNVSVDVNPVSGMPTAVTV